MKFTSEEKLLDCIRTGVDLYSPSLELYMFLYNDAGAVCTYSIAHDHALELVQQDEYWEAYLGPGGSIYDDPEGEFENEWDADDWISVSREQASWVDENANNVVCYIPEKRVLIFMQEGSGCNFDNEDVIRGYDAYVDYTTYWYDGDDIFKDYPEYEDSDEFMEYDGGDMMYKFSGTKTWTSKIEDTIRMALDMDEDEDVTYLILAEDFDI